MRIHPEGLNILRVVFILGVACIVAFKLLAISILIPSILFIVFILFVIAFFRFPHRESKALLHEIISPADGKVVVIEEIFEDEVLNEKRKQISIFMSPANVHVNWIPFDGSITYLKHHPGKYLMAWHPKSSTENERFTVVISGEKNKILFRQIAGFFARRIVNDLENNEEVMKGEPFGIIKFGSRVDVMVPADAEIVVQLNQKVKGAETVLARLK